jgi:hypothetical protein
MDARSILAELWGCRAESNTSAKLNNILKEHRKICLEINFTKRNRVLPQFVRVT